MGAGCCAGGRSGSRRVGREPEGRVDRRRRRDGELRSHFAFFGSIRAGQERLRGCQGCNDPKARISHRSVDVPAGRLHRLHEAAPARRRSRATVASTPKLARCARRASSRCGRRDVFLALDRIGRGARLRSTAAKIDAYLDARPGLGSPINRFQAGPATPSRS